MEYKVRILLGTYMSFLDDSRTPNAFGWACRFVLGKPATACAAVPPHPHPHRHSFPLSTCHLPSTHRPPTHCPPTVPPPPSCTHHVGIRGGACYNVPFGWSI